MRLRQTPKVEIPFCIVEKEAAFSTTTSLTRIPRQKFTFFQISFLAQRKSKEIFPEKGRVLRVRITEIDKDWRERGLKRQRKITKKKMGDEMRGSERMGRVRKNKASRVE